MNFNFPKSATKKIISRCTELDEVTNILKKEMLDAVAAAEVTKIALYDGALAAKFIKCQEVYVLEIVRYSLLYFVLMAAFRILDEDKRSFSLLKVVKLLGCKNVRRVICRTQASRVLSQFVPDGDTENSDRDKRVKQFARKILYKRALQKWRCTEQEIIDIRESYYRHFTKDKVASAKNFRDNVVAHIGEIRSGAASTEMDWAEPEYIIKNVSDLLSRLFIVVLSTQVDFVEQQQVWNQVSANFWNGLPNYGRAVMPNKDATTP